MTVGGASTTAELGPRDPFDDPEQHGAHEALAALQSDLPAAVTADLADYL